MYKYIPLFLTIFQLTAHDRPVQLENPPREIPSQEMREMQEKRAEREKEHRNYRALKKMDVTTHMGAFHRPIMISPLGDKITTEDGAIYSVYSGDRFKTYNWLTTDALKITPNHSWFTTYLYRITNVNTNESVEVNIIENPVFNGVYTHWIVAIDVAQGQVCLEDGSIWNLSGFDYSIYKRWLPNDTIIIGTNDGFFSGSKPNILINCNILSYPYSEARCIN